MTHYVLSSAGFPYPTEVRMGFNRTGSATGLGQLVQWDTGLTSTEATGFSVGPNNVTDVENDGLANFVDVQHTDAAGTNRGYYGIALGVIPDNQMGPILVRGGVTANVLYNPAGGGVPVEPRTPLGASAAAAAIADKLSICSGNNKKVLAILLERAADDATAQLRYVLFDGICGLGRP